MRDPDADTGGQVDANILVDARRRRDLFANGFGAFEQIGAVLVSHQYRELFTAQSRHDGIIWRRKFDLLGGVSQNDIAGFMALHVIDLLEVIEIDNEQA